jgi:hypothetical protein
MYGMSDGSYPVKDPLSQSFQTFIFSKKEKKVRKKIRKKILGNGKAEKNFIR